MIEGQILIDGAWRELLGGGTIAAINPSDGSSFGSLARGTAEDVDAAVRAARAALDGEWGRMPAFERGRILARLGQLVLEQADALADPRGARCRQALRQAKADALALARYLEFYGGAADKVHGATIPYQAGYTVMTLREPHGVTGHIIPWNYPMQILGRSIGAALAMGNAAVLKPGEDASMSALMVGKLALEAGLPAGVLNIVTGHGEEAGAALAAHPGVDHVSFTGSLEAGRLVQQAAATQGCAVTLSSAASRRRSCSPMPISTSPCRWWSTPRCRMPARPARPARACWSRTGSTTPCRRGRRPLPHARRRPGRGRPRLRSPDQSAAEDPGRRLSGAGAKDRLLILAEGKIAPNAPAEGFYAKPTLLGDVPPDHPLAQEEMFGPVLAAMRFTDEADAIRLANRTPYGLAAGVWTRAAAASCASRARSRPARCSSTATAPAAASSCVRRREGLGLGRRGFEALYGFSALKTIAIRHG